MKPVCEDVGARAAHRDPDALLRRVEAAERAAGRGQLKVFLGYASGVGKSFRLFDEGRRRRARGEDVVVAAMQANPSPDLVSLAQDLERIPTVDAEGTAMVDVPAVLVRRPAVCLIDGLAYDYPPGHRHATRYEDIDELLDGGVSVLTSINLEFIREQQAFVAPILGRTRRNTVPQSFIERADEVVVVDAPATEQGGLTPQQLSLLRQSTLR